MKNSYGNSFIRSQSRIDFLTRGKAATSNQKSAVRMNQSVRKRVHVVFHSQKFVELLRFSRKFAINHRQNSNVFIALDKPIKKNIQEEQSKKTRTRWDAWLACLANFSTEGRGKKSFKEGKYAVSHFRRQRVLPSKEMSESSKQTTKKSKARETNQTQVKRGKHYEKYLH